MAEDIKVDNVSQEASSKTTGKKSSQKTAATKQVRNRSTHKIELLINGKVQVFKPGCIVEVPADTVIPKNIGLFVRRGGK